MAAISLSLITAVVISCENDPNFNPPAMAWKQKSFIESLVREFSALRFKASIDLPFAYHFFIKEVLITYTFYRARRVTYPQANMQQWRIQGRGPGGGAPPLIFRQKWGPKGQKKFFWRPPPSPPLSKGPDPPLCSEKRRQKKRTFWSTTEDIYSLIFECLFKIHKCIAHRHLSSNLWTRLSQPFTPCSN